MARIEDKIAEIKDPELRRAIAEEVKALKEKKQFGLVFETHQPEVVPMFRVPVRVGTAVAKKTGSLGETYHVVRVLDGIAELIRDADDSRETVPVDSLVVVRPMGEPIYPALVPRGAIENGDPQQPHHILIEADNYHALQLLEYLYAGRVDCIYIDPPYNTGARDWKYNNDYVDANDQWRHSKWLAFIEKRLRLARRLLKPDIGVLIVTIDEHEVHHLGCLLEQVFPDTYRQMVTIVINQKGVAQGRLSRAEEYAIFCFMKGAFILPHHDDLLSPGRADSKQLLKPRWERLLRGGTNSRREDRPGLFFPIHINTEKRAIIEIGDPLPLAQSPDLSAAANQTIAWPLRTDGSLGNWRVSPPTLRELVARGYVKLGGYDEDRKTWTVLYLGRKAQTQIDTGVIQIVGRDPKTGVVDVEYAEAQGRQIKTVWHRSIHDSGNYGSSLLRSILGDGGSFSFPKSLYAERDAVAAVVRDRHQALVVDFFAGSGTTLHAVNLLNATDGGKRRCILVTNNEVSEDQAKSLSANGHRPGDPDWEKNGICRSVTWPRCKFTILGKRDDGTPLPGDYLTGCRVTKEKPRVIRQLGFCEGRVLSVVQRKQLAALVPAVPQSKIEADAPWVLDDDISASILWDVTQAEAWLETIADADHITEFYAVTRENRLFNQLKAQIQETLGPIQYEEEEKRPLADGFPANLAYFKLDFLEPVEVAMGRQFAAVLPILWMMAGAKGLLPEAPDPGVPWLIPEGCALAVLMQEARFREFVANIEQRADLTHVFLVTNSESAFHDMRETLPARITAVQLYQNYLENFKLNTHRV